MQRLAAAGAHYVIDGVADLLPVVDLIEGRLARGERPWIACSSADTQPDHRLFGRIRVDGGKAHDEAAAAALPWRYWIDSGETLMP